jgi:hypothetical protein
MAAWSRHEPPVRAPVSERAEVATTTRSARTQRGSALTARYRCRVLLAAVLLGLAGGCTFDPDPANSPAVPDEPAIPLSAPAGGSRLDFDVDAFDPCSPFNSPAWIEYTFTVDPPVPAATGCRWQGRGLTAAIRLETGRSLAEISADPRFRPGGSGSVGNRYWQTGTSDATRYCHAFLAVGPARPDRVVHLSIETDGPAAPVQLPGYPDQHACQFVYRLTYITGGILQAAVTSPR